MFTPSLNPQHATNTPGKSRRYVTGTRLIRPVRFDGESDDALNWLRHHLAVPHNCQDLASVSMVCRRAIRLYYRHLATIVHDPSELEKERNEVRSLTQLPRRKRTSLSL